MSQWIILNGFSEFYRETTQTIDIRVWIHHHILICYIINLMRIKSYYNAYKQSLLWDLTFFINN